VVEVFTPAELVLAESAAPDLAVSDGAAASAAAVTSAAARLLAASVAPLAIIANVPANAPANVPTSANVHSAERDTHFFSVISITLIKVRDCPGTGDCQKTIAPDSFG